MKPWSTSVRRPLVAATVLLATLALTGCRPPDPVATRPPTESTSRTEARGATVPVGTSTQPITVDGRERSYRVTRPATLPTPTPLVVMLHGGFGDAAQAEQGYGWDEAATRHGFVVVYPDGLNRAWSVGAGCCGRPGAARVDDVAFVEAVVRQVSAALPVDPQRVFATGISNGGMMAYRLACDSTLFAAVGPDSATQLGDCPHPGRLSVIAVHGTADQNVPYDGGPGQGVAHIDGPAVPAVNAFWRGVDGCSAPRTTTLRRSQTVHESIASCPAGRDVELVTVDGAGHQWPGPDRRTPAQKALSRTINGADVPSSALDATATIWAFFAAHPKP